MSVRPRVQIFQSRYAMVLDAAYGDGLSDEAVLAAVPASRKLIMR